jgi:chromosome segregation and condensation protein ScpB
VVSNLELRDLVKEIGRGTGPGQPKLYGTTIRFLQMLGLESLEDLPFPDTRELPDHEEAEDGEEPELAATGPEEAPRERQEEAPSPSA